jgi:hypothetical protein
MQTADIPAPQPNIHYKPDEIILYGVSLDGGSSTVREGVIPFDDNFVILQVRRASPAGTPLDPNAIAMAVVYGYAYEGYCYRYDRPRVLVFEYRGLGAPAAGCGFEPPYMMWRIAEKKKILELNTRMDLAEILVLDANLPGNRPPNTYGNKARLAHRGGRLTE